MGLLLQHCACIFQGELDTLELPELPLPAHLEAEVTQERVKARLATRPCHTRRPCHTCACPCMRPGTGTGCRLQATAAGYMPGPHALTP